MKIELIVEDRRNHCIIYASSCPFVTPFNDTKTANELRKAPG
jgi:hypothetical protein